MGCPTEGSRVRLDFWEPPSAIFVCGSRRQLFRLFCGGFLSTSQARRDLVRVLRGALGARCFATVPPKKSRSNKTAEEDSACETAELLGSCSGEVKDTPDDFMNTLINKTLV